MNTFNSIHIFKFGKVQVVGELGKLVDASAIPSLQSFIDHIKTFKPVDVVIDDYHVIHIFKDEIKYLGKNNSQLKPQSNFKVKLSQVDSTLLTELINDLADQI